MGFPSSWLGKACPGELGEHLSGLWMCTEGKDMGHGGPGGPCLQSRGPLRPGGLPGDSVDALAFRMITTVRAAAGQCGAPRQVVGAFPGSSG